MGTIFEYQGRYGAELNAKNEALTTLRGSGEKGFWLASVLGGYGNALAMIGRGPEAEKSLAEAVNLAGELKNQALMAQILNYQGDRLFYAGDYRGARDVFEHAAQVASRTTDRNVALVSRFNLAKVAVKEGRIEKAVGSLTELTGQADTMGLKHLSTACSVSLGEALLAKKDYAQARRVLEASLGKSEKLGLRTLLAQSHYLLAAVVRHTGREADVSRHLSEARRIVEDIHKEAQTDAVLTRSDLAPLYKEPAHQAASFPISGTGR
jgi:tetratricopeptide (TPR) repeat protein